MAQKHSFRYSNLAYFCPYFSLDQPVSVSYVVYFKHQVGVFRCVLFYVVFCMSQLKDDTSWTYLHSYVNAHLHCIYNGGIASAIQHFFYTSIHDKKCIDNKIKLTRNSNLNHLSNGFIVWMDFSQPRHTITTFCLYGEGAQERGYS